MLSLLLVFVTIVAADGSREHARKSLMVINNDLKIVFLLNLKWEINNC